MGEEKHIYTLEMKKKEKHQIEFHFIVSLNDFRVDFALMRFDTFYKFPSTVIRQIEHFDVFADGTLIDKIPRFLSIFIEQKIH